MWASGSMEWNSSNPIMVNDKLRQSTKCSKVYARKSSRGGDSIFVTLQKQITNQKGLCMTESRSLVYLSQKPKIVHQQPIFKNDSNHIDFSIIVKPTVVSLFRFSALTYNSHRIHYDYKYALEEGYGGLLVHGPLTISLLLEALSSKLESDGLNFVLKRVDYTATRPLLCDKVMILNGRYVKGSIRDLKAEIWATDEDGVVAMKGTVQLCLLDPVD
jgi:3-methylfumaryl-CoA hydratase